MYAIRSYYAKRFLLARIARAATRPLGSFVGPTDEFELEARRCGYRRIAGLDEAGRGPLAGPVVAASYNFV